MGAALSFCPRCGAANSTSAQICSLCQAPLTEGVPGVAAAAGSSPGVASLAGSSPGAAVPTHGGLRRVPTLLFNEAADSNVRMSFLLFAALFALFVLLGGTIGRVYGSAGLGLSLAFILYGILAATAWYNGSSIVLSLHGARDADPSAHRQFINVVEEMAVASGLPPPRVCVIETSGMNAFAAGREPREAVVAATTGLIANLDREELQGVVAHEMAHIKSRDTLYNICAAVLVGAVATLSDVFLRGTFFGGRGRSGGRGDARGNVALVLLALLLAVLAPLAARLLQMSISRQREYHADAAAAAFTRNPLGLASALEKIARGGASVPGENRGTQHLFIVNPIRAFSLTSGALMSTHPPTELRIQRLKMMAGLGASE